MAVSRPPVHLLVTLNHLFDAFFCQLFMLVPVFHMVSLIFSLNQTRSFPEPYTKQNSHT